MSLRRYVNLVDYNYAKQLYSLRRLAASQFFYPTAEAAATHVKDLPIQRKVQPCPYFGMSKANAAKNTQHSAASPELESVRHPPALFSIRPSSCPAKKFGNPNLTCFSLSASKVLFANSAARATYYDMESRCVVPAPSLHAPKRHPFAVSVPSPSPDGKQHDDSLYIMEKNPLADKNFQFEALVCGHGPKDGPSDEKNWHCDVLPLPPYVHEPCNEPAAILSYAVVGNTICISVEDVGTYCFDTVSKTWSRAGDWLMPFFGKAEYVPELKLWFGISAIDGQLPCAADLSPVVRGHSPVKKCIWRDPEVPDEWRTPYCDPAEIISLGSGRFCLISFFQGKPFNGALGEAEFGRKFAVFTGLEVITSNGNSCDSGAGNENDVDSTCNGNGKPRMLKHKSKSWDIVNTSVIKSVH